MPLKNKEKRRAYKKALRKKHVDNKTYYCEKCDVAFQGSYNLNRHLKRDTHINFKKLYTCHECKYASSLLSRFKRHTKTKKHLNTIKKFKKKPIIFKFPETVENIIMDYADEIKPKQMKRKMMLVKTINHYMDHRRKIYGSVKIVEGIKFIIDDFLKYFGLGYRYFTESYVNIPIIDIELARATFFNNHHGWNSHTQSPSLRDQLKLSYSDNVTLYDPSETRIFRYNVFAKSPEELELV